MSRDSKGPRRTSAGSGSSDRRRSFSDTGKTKKTYGSDKPSFKRKEGGSAESRSYGKRDGFDKPSFRKKEGGSTESRSYGKRDGSDRGFVKRADGKYESTSPRRAYDDGEKRSYSEGGERKPRKSYGDGEKRSYSEGTERKPRRSYDDGENRGYSEGGERKPRKSYGGDGESRGFVKRADGKYESTGRSSRESASGEKRPYAKKEYGKKDDEKKAYGEKSYGKKEYVKKDAAERKPRRNFEDNDQPEGYEKKAYKPRAPRDEKPVKVKKAGPKRTSDQPNVSDDAVRLNRYIANAGICSRREADVLIATGVVSVNGKIITEMGYKVNPTDTVTYGGVPIRNEVKKYLLLNKPKDYITTMDDPEERRTVMELVKKACKERLYPVGRLDRNTTGVLLFTNDGDMTAKLTHPKFNVRKVYHVSLNKKMTGEDFMTLNEGVELSDGFIKPDAMEFVGAGKSELGVEIHSGRNRIVRRMFEHLGYEVMKLDRVSFAGLTKKDLPRGKYRFLTEKEVSFLKMLG